jgi:hypothetical protein
MIYWISYETIIRICNYLIYKGLRQFVKNKNKLSGIFDTCCLMYVNIYLSIIRLSFLHKADYKVTRGVCLNADFE